MHCVCLFEKISFSLYGPKGSGHYVDPIILYTVGFQLIGQKVSQNFQKKSDKLVVYVFL